MKIRLKEIPAEGRNYRFDRKSGELNTALRDLIGERPHDVEMTVKPMGNAFEVAGYIETSLGEVCSKCGWDFEMPVKSKLRDILVEDAGPHVKMQAGHTNQSIDYLAQGPSVYYYSGDNFDVGQYIHEAIGLAEPIYPMCSGETCSRQEEADAILNKLAGEFAEADQVIEETSAFAALKALNLSNTTEKQDKSEQ